jgi:catechol 2,3-dioxygenase-like lactoylglutathione lyase family enzyme
MPNLENLRKQAKLYLHWHRDRYFPVAAQIRQFVARFHHLSDREILDQPFKLADAQNLVAKKSGFESWQALKQGLATMTPAESSIAPTTMLAAEPQLFVADIAASCDFFTRKLGFQVAFTYGEPPFYAQVVRDGARMNLRKVCQPAFDAGFRAREKDALSASITLDDAKSLFLEFQTSGATFHQLLRTEPWGARMFIVRDPDGNLIAFSGAA